MKELDIEKVERQQPELQLALQLIDQIAADSYDPAAVRRRGEAAHPGGHRRQDRRQRDRPSRARRRRRGGQIIDLMEALRASLGGKKPARGKRGRDRAGRRRRGSRRRQPSSARHRSAPAPVLAEPRPRRRPRGARKEVADAADADVFGARASSRCWASRAAVIASLVASGFVTPGARAPQRIPLHLPGRGAAAHRLQPARGAHPGAQDPALAARLRATLPREVPLAGLRITAVGNEVAVQEGSARRHVESGQLLFDFDGQAPSATVRVSPVRPISRPSSRPRNRRRLPSPTRANGSGKVPGWNRERPWPRPATAARWPWRRAMSTRT